MRDFLAEYTARSDDLCAFYAKSHQELHDSPPATRDWDGGLVRDIQTFHSARGHAADFAGTAAVVITRQQACIFTGPMYTSYKAVTTIVLARRLEERTGVATVPVFWIGSEDHDFDEACTTYFLGKNHEPFPIRYRPSDPVDDLPMYKVALDGSLHAGIDEAAANTGGSEFRDEVAALLHETLDASDSLADWTTRLLMRLFKDTPLVFFAPHLPAARCLAAEIIEKEIRDPLATTALLNEAGRALERLDFAPQVVKKDTECCFFIEDGDRRKKVVYEKGRFITPDDDRDYSEAELLEGLGASPERMARFGEGKIELAALAGTVPRGADPISDAAHGRYLLANPKEREEHRIVVEDIVEAVRGLGRVEIPATPQVVKLNNLQHLSTPITLFPNTPQHPIALLGRLHPTAAVGGRPRETAFRLIGEFERFERGWYGSPIGWMNAGGKGEFAASLRSGLRDGRRFLRRAGGALLPVAEPARG